MSTSVKFFRSTMTGAPSLDGVAGSLIGVLDACLVNGFNLRTFDTLVVAGNVATATVNAGHGYTAEMVVLVAGATPAGLNGEKRIISATTTTFTFAAPGISDQTATGTISCRVAPAGWEKVFSGTNLAVYRSTDVTGTREFLRVDDTGTTTARVVGYENMTDVNTGTGPFPNSTQVSGGGFWYKSIAANATVRGWEIFADSKTFYIKAQAGGTNLEGGQHHGFGDYQSKKSGDAYACFLQCDRTNQVTSSGLTQDHVGASYGTVLTVGLFVARSYTGLGGSVTLPRRAIWLELPGATQDAASGSVGYTYPNGPNNGLLLGKQSLVEGAFLRGLFRGFSMIPQNCHAAFTNGDMLNGQDDLSGRRLAVSKLAGPNTSTSAGMILFDITGPWE
jgi:hypothetical protein